MKIDANNLKRLLEHGDYSQAVFFIREEARNHPYLAVIADFLDVDLKNRLDELKHELKILEKALGDLEDE